MQGCSEMAFLHLSSKLLLFDSPFGNSLHFCPRKFEFPNLRCLASQFSQSLTHKSSTQQLNYEINLKVSTRGKQKEIIISIPSECTPVNSLSTYCATDGRIQFLILSSSVTPVACSRHLCKYKRT